MEPDATIAACRALGDATRWRILRFLLDACCPPAIGERGEVVAQSGPTAGEVCCHVTGDEKINSTISFHLKELRAAGLIRAERRGRHTVCSPDREAIRRLAASLELMASPDPPPSNMNEPTPSRPDDVRKIVRQKYGDAASRVLDRGGAVCCGSGPTSSCCAPTDPITADLYSPDEASAIPEAALLASLGCGNPTALAELKEGEVVLDLGSGGGVDVLLSARRVGPSGFVYGLDMTDEMLALAERNRRAAGAENVRFLRGEIEHIPLASESVDVIVSNCVINLAADKDAVLREAFRVLRPGGRFAVSDVVVEGDLPPTVRRDMEMYVGCVAGALEREEYLAKLRAAGFEGASVEPTRRYEFSALEGAWSADGIAGLTDTERQALDGKIMGAFIRATKPGAA